METPALGARERKADPRDFNLGTITSSNPRPAAFIQDFSALPVEHQRKIPACGSHAGAFLKNIQETLQTGTAQRKSPRFLWKKIKQIDTWKPEEGTDMLSIFKTLQKEGVCDYSLTGNDTTVSLAEYTDPSTITKAMEDDAKNALISDGYAFKFSPTFDELKQAIYEHKAVLVLIRLGSEFWTPSWAEEDVLPLRVPKTIVGGHFVVAYSYDEKYIYFRNSWSDAWGRKGDGYFGENYMPYVNEIGTCFDVPQGRFMKNLSYGQMSFDVLALQRFLVSHGFGTYMPTGFFGDRTFASVIAFQLMYNIPTTGYVGILTRTKLNTLS